MGDECEGIWKEALMTYISSFVRRDAEANTVRMATVPAEIRAQHLSNTSVEQYRCANPRCVSVVIEARILNSFAPGGGRILSTQISILEVV
jgi:hypothetical protein